MKRDNEFNNILDECLERLLVKGETIDQCLLSYPEYAAELESLLNTVMATKQALAIQPSPEFKSRARYQIGLALQEVKPKRRLPFLGWQPRWAMAMAVFLVLLLAGVGTVAAARYSMPDNLLYPVKLATERVQLILTFSDIGKAELYAKLADRRVAEIVYVVNKGKTEQVEPTAERLNNSLVSIASLSSAESGRAKVMLTPESAPMAPERAEDTGEEVYIQDDKRAKLRMLLGRYAVEHPAALRTLLETAPESAKPVLRQTITISVASYEEALKALD